MPLVALFFRDNKCVGVSFWLTSFHITFLLYSLNLLQAPFSTHIYPSVLFFFKCVLLCLRTSKELVWGCDEYLIDLFYLHVLVSIS